MKTLFSILLAILFMSVSYSQQSLFMQREIKKAYENGTRNYDGTPGENYWINHSSYKIDAELFPDKKLLKATEEIKYFNNSPDTLSNIVIRLYQDIYKKGTERDISIGSESVTDGLVISKIIVNDSLYELDTDKPKFRKRGTNMFIKLNKDLIPGEYAKLYFDWEFTIPSNTRARMGEYDSTTFFIAYWYPQVSVYDDIDGWDTYDYVGHEFYNDFNDFDINITVPSGFNIWATGELQNSDEVYSTYTNNKINLAKNSDTVINIITIEDIEKGKVFKKNDKTTFKYSAKHVPDFAFGVSDHYLWDGVNFKQKDETNVFISAAYGEEANDFKNVASIGKQSIKYFSNELPGVSFPYPVMTVFNGLYGGGMEFPMIVNNTSVPFDFLVFGLTAHEIAHSYFPFDMGINEHKYAWMDEGWATMLPFEFEKRNVEDFNPISSQAFSYSRIAGTADEIPPMVASYIPHVRSTSFNTMAYSRSSVAYYFLQDILGKELFQKALQEFINRWNGKHPSPFDFFFTFNDVSGQDLSWFWNPWYFDFGYPDLEIVDYSVNGNEVTVNIKRNGNVPVPVKLTITNTEGKESTSYQNATVWKDGKTTLSVKGTVDGDINKIVLGDEYIPDSEKGNNEIIVNEMKFTFEYLPEDLEEFAGEYSISEHFNISIFLKDGKMFGQATGQEAFELVPIGINVFKVKDEDIEITFVRDINEKIGQLKLNQGGFKVTADKIK